MPSIVKKRIVSFLKIIFAVGLIIWLIQSGKLDFSHLRSILRIDALLICLLLIGLNIFFSTERWRLLLKSQGFHRSPLETLRLALVGLFFNFVIPGGVGGDVIKGFYLARENPQARMKSIVTIAMDRLLGLFSMLVMALLVMIIDYDFVRNGKELFAIFSVLCLLFVGFAVFWALIFSRRLVNLGWIEKILGLLPGSAKLLNMYRSFSEYRDFKKVFFQSLILSFISQIFAILFFVYIGYLFGFNDLSLNAYFFVVPVGFMVTAIPISPAGVGVGQAAFYFFFNLVQKNPTHLGSSAITAYQIFVFIYGLIGAYFYITLRKPLSQVNELKV